MLVENQKVGAADLFAALAIEEAADETVPSLDGIDEEPPVRQLLAGFRHGASGFNVRKNAPVAIRYAADKFPHSSQFTSIQTVAG